MTADLLLTGGIILPLDDTPALPRGSMVVEQGRIKQVGPSDQVDPQVDAAEIIDCRDCIVLPGLINAHTHVALNACRGLTHGAVSPLYDVMWPVEKHLTPDDVHDLALLGLVECLKSGATCVADHYFFMESIATAVVSCGIRGILGHTIMASGGPWVGAQELEEGLAFVERWQNRHPLIHPVLAPHAPDTMTTSWLQQVAEAATRLDTRIHIHLAQTAREVEAIYRRAGKTPIAYLADLGILGPRVVAAHCSHATTTDLDILAESGATPVYCATTHALRGNLLRASELLERGIRVALGSDCAAGNDDYDMLEEMRAAITGQRVLRGRPDVMAPEAVLHMATRDNAAAWGLEEHLGTLTPGKQADILVLRGDTPRMTPLFNPIANVVLCASEREVDCVIVGGRKVVQKGRVLTVDENEVVQRGRRAAVRVIERARAADPHLFTAIAPFLP